MTACMQDSRSIFDVCLVLDGLREVANVQDQLRTAAEGGLEVRKEKRDSSLVREVSERMICSACRCPFDSREEQMEHYKLDWHRFNLRQKMLGLHPVTAEEFEKKTGTGDMSSISGSESDSSSDEDDSEWAGQRSDVSRVDNEASSDTDCAPVRRSSKVVFQNEGGQYLMVYRCVLQAKCGDEEDLVGALKSLSSKSVWVVLMTGGGHFAGAIFKGKEVLQHKTFHRYTVRAKRGTAQGLRDAQNRSHAPKSAGAALRRYNEAVLVKEVQDLLETWAEHLKVASAIFLRSPSYNKTLFFGGRGAPLDKRDPRVRTLPFATRRATFKEVKRVHEVLSTVQVYGKDMEVSAILSPSKKVWKKTTRPVIQPCPAQEIKAAADEEDEDSHSGKEEGDEIQLETVEVTLGTLDLREYEIQPSRQKRKKRRKKAGNHESKEGPCAEDGGDLEDAPQEVEPTKPRPQEKAQKNKAKKKAHLQKKQLEEDAGEEWWDYRLRDALYTACKTGDVHSLTNLLQPPGQAGGEEQGVPEEAGDGGRSHPRHQQPPAGLSALGLLNRPVDPSGFTLLHVASAAAQKAAVWMLLERGADPACRDAKGHTPYVVAPEKETRSMFRKFMAENPDKYDYNKAQVPGPLTAEIELKQTEKKKAQKAAKKQREKEQKEERRKQELEEEEKKRFASLSDREKRALAAERRLAEQAAATGVSITNVQRCWQCGDSLLGKIPFHYLTFSFCTPRCVQAHRKANAPASKS